ncbi:MAG: ANTAR domain-containing protein [Actinomycetota bacterium]|nr:ANTAR domain-containing protein [Actinomycetota bacterium]
MQRYGVSEERAFEVLRRHCQHHNLKLRDVAEELVDRGSIGLDGEAPGAR